MYPSITPARVATFVASLALGSCASLDTAEDVDFASRLVAERTEIPAVDWQEHWEPRSLPWPPVRPLTADDVARLALQNHPGIRATVESIAQARADYVQAHLLPNPVINFTLGFSIDGGSGNPGMGGLLQPLAALWQRSAEIDASRSRLRASVLAVSDAAITLVAEARLAHARLVFAERDLRMERADLELAVEVLELVERRFAAGEATGLERNRVALDLVQAEMHVTETEVRRDRALRVLLERCGVAGATDVPEIEPTVEPAPQWITELAETDVLALAEQQRLDLAAAHALAEGAVDDVRLAELRWLRAVSLGASYQRNFQDREAIGPSFALEIPLFDDGRAETAGAESRARAAAAELERIRQATLAEVRAAWVRLRGDLAHLSHVRDMMLGLAKHNRGIAEQTLAQGVGDRSTVLDFTRRELRAELEASRIELEVVEAFVELERAVGGQITMLRQEVE